MNAARKAQRLAAIGGCVVLTTVGCGFQGLNSMPLPGAVGAGSSAAVYHLEIANVGTLEPNSPVMIDNVIVGSVADMTFDNWHAAVTVSVEPDTVVPANAVVAVGQTSLLGSMHIALDPPLGTAPEGRLPTGATIPLSSATTYPSTEQTLASLSTLVNAGGLGRIGDVVRSMNAALSGREVQARDVLSRLDAFVGVFDEQRGDVVEAIKALDRLSAGLVAQREVLSTALRALPDAIDVLIQQRPNLIGALQKLGTLGDTASRLVDDAGDDLVANLEDLAPTIKALADVGPEIAQVLGYLPTAPFGQNIIDRGIRGDFMNLFIILDFTTARLKRTLLAGTRFEDQDAQLVPAPGDLGYDAYYTRNPLGAPISPPPASYEDSLKIPPPPPAPAAPQGGG